MSGTAKITLDAEIDQNQDQASRRRSASGLRASDRGILPISVERYLVLLDLMGRREAAGKRGKIPAELPSVRESLAIDGAEAWQTLYDEFADQVALTYQSKVNDEAEVELPLVNPSKTNQDALM